MGCGIARAEEPLVQATEHDAHPRSLSERLARPSSSITWA